MKIIFVFFLAFVFLTIPPSHSFDENMSPRQQWETIADPELLTCKDDYILLQKNNGYPACVTPFTYLKLIDREFTKINFTLINNRPDMVHSLMQTMISNQILMNHWHDMLIKNPKIMDDTMNTWISEMKENPKLLANIMVPITTDPHLREKMVELMKNHPLMENSLTQNHAWMSSVHSMPIHSEMDEYTMKKENSETSCSACENKPLSAYCVWCTGYPYNIDIKHSMGFSNSDVMVNLIHHMWINEKMNQEMHSYMLQDSHHMAMMSEHMLNQILIPIMDDPQLQSQMIELMLKNQEFMNTIRHEN